MGILDELSSATGDKNSNKEMVKRCLVTPGLLHSIAESLRTSTPKAKLDCAQILLEVAQRNPEVLATFVSDFLDASKNKGKLGRLGFSGLALLVAVNPSEVYAERQYLFDAAKVGGADGLAAAAVLAALCAQNANYRGKLLAGVVRLLNDVGDADLVKWTKALGPAVEGSADSLRRLTTTLQPRREQLDEPTRRKLDQLLVKLERSTIKRRP